MNIKKVNVFMGIIFFKLYFIYLVFKNVVRKLGNILIELLKKSSIWIFKINLFINK